MLRELYISNTKHEIIHHVTLQAGPRFDLARSGYRSMTDYFLLLHVAFGKGN